ncbi:hypothetical protein lerEdw1_017754 [Lerista edwardsae]|nr:hypothetical protein lerEdw1_017754 [Lerista edwardsae]
MEKIGSNKKKLRSRSKTCVYPKLQHAFSAFREAVALRQIPPHTYSPSVRSWKWSFGKELNNQFWVSREGTTGTF